MALSERVGTQNNQSLPEAVPSLKDAIGCFLSYDLNESAKTNCALECIAFARDLCEYLRVWSANGH